MNSVFPIATAILMSVSTAIAAAEPVVSSPCEQGAIRVDGMLDEEAWSRAPVGHVARSLSDAPAPVETTFRIMHTEDRLLLGIHCSQPDMDALRMTVTERDDGVWNDDCIELFIDPSGRGEGESDSPFNHKPP